jgi:hypothetical protein
LEFEKKIEEVFSEGWFNYFNTQYGVDDFQTNEEMIGDIDKKIKELKTSLRGKEVEKIGRGENE